MTQLNKKQKTSTDKKPLILNFFVNASATLHFSGQWKNPRDRQTDYYKPEFWVELAQLGERGKINAIFIADSLAIYDSYKGPHNYSVAAKSGNNFPKNDPTAYLSLAAYVTKSIGFGVTASTISEHPYHWARRLATLDHATNGRVGWNIVSSFVPAASRQLLNNTPLPPKNERYEKTDEYLQVVEELLLSSWRDDGIVLDKEEGIIADPERIREINFEGKYFQVPGPQITQPSPQRFPLLIQAGASPKGQLLGAKQAEAIYVGGNGESPEQIFAKVQSVKTIAKEKYGRDPDWIKFIAGGTAIIGKTEQEAEEKWQEILKYRDFEGAQAQFGGAGRDISIYDYNVDLTTVEDDDIRTIALNLQKAKPGVKITRQIVAETWSLGKSIFRGTAEQVADQLEDFVNRSGIDGFNFSSVVFPETFENIVDLLIPVLQERGLAQKEYAVPGGTFRENTYGIKGQKYFPDSHPASKLQWKAGQSIKNFEKQLEEAHLFFDEHRITKE